MSPLSAPSGGRGVISASARTSAVRPPAPRLVVTRSLRNITAQIVDDAKGHTLVSASTLDATIRGTEGDKSALASKVGALLAERAKAAGISKVVFDRGGNRYAGRIAALADAAREAGLEF